MIVIFTFLIGIALLWAGKIETLTLNKTLDMIELRKTNMMCRNKVEVRDISKIFSLNAYKLGHDGMYVFTTNYEIKATFK